MNKMMTLLICLTTSLCFAHDEGHGPAIKDESLNGGKISAIIMEGDISKGRRAKMLYKSELVYESRGREVKVYVYDKNMKPVNLKDFSKKISAVQIERSKQTKFDLELDASGKYFKGVRPLNKRVPFNIDVRFINAQKRLFSAFDGLD